MKKVIFIMLAVALSAAANAQRFSTVKGDDNTGRVLTYAYLTPVYAATISINPNNFETIVKVGLLTGSATVNLLAARSQVGDKLTIMYLTDAAATHIITYGTNISAAGTQTLNASKRGAISFMFDGTKFIEKGRGIE
jgi:hypothetical protein